MDDEDEQHAVTSGLTALLAVGLAVGLFLGIVAFVGVKVLGIGGGSPHADSTPSASLYLPTPSDAGGNVGPVVSLAPDHPSDEFSTLPDDTSSATTNAPTALTLSSPQLTVGPGQRIELTGSGPEGHVLVVQRMENGAWANFAGVVAHVRAGVFQTWVETTKPGDQQWRVVDPDGNATSNAVTVTVG